MQVGEHIPVKQGLRPSRSFFSSGPNIPVGEHIPVKQGLRQVTFRTFGENFTVGEHIPVKQGLRQIIHICNERVRQIATKNTIK